MNINMKNKSFNLSSVKTLYLPKIQKFLKYSSYFQLLLTILPKNLPIFKIKSQKITKHILSLKIVFKHALSAPFNTLNLALS